MQGNVFLPKGGIVNVHLTNGKNRVLETAVRVIANYYATKDTPTLLCLDSAGKVVGQFKWADISGYEIEPPMDRMLLEKH